MRSLLSPHTVFSWLHYNGKYKWKYTTLQNTVAPSIGKSTEPTDFALSSSCIVCTDIQDFV